MQAELDLVAHARRTDPATSHEAAASLSSDKLRRSQEAVLRVLREGEPFTGKPMTDERLVEAYEQCVRLWQCQYPKQSPSGIRTRRKELVERGFVKAMGTTVLASGRRAIVWGAAK